MVASQRSSWGDRHHDQGSKVGQIEEGLAVVSEALEIVNKNEERIYEAELYRLQGELSLQSRHVKASQNQSEVTIPQGEAEAEECFQKAIEITREQQAKSFELRAVISLARLWAAPGQAWRGVRAAGI